MTTYKNVRNFTKAWAKKTYAEGVADLCEGGARSRCARDGAARDEETEHCRQADDGRFVPRPSRIDEGRTTVRFSEVIDELIDTFLTPGIVCGRDRPTFAGEPSRIRGGGRDGPRVARVPSFLREMDLGWKVGKECEARGLGGAGLRGGCRRRHRRAHGRVLEPRGQGLSFVVVPGFRARPGQREVQALWGARGGARRRASCARSTSRERAMRCADGVSTPSAGSRRSSTSSRTAPAVRLRGREDDLDRCVREVCLIESVALALGRCVGDGRAERPSLGPYAPTA